MTGGLAALASCGGEDLVLPGDGRPAAIAVLSGNGQAGIVGEPLSDSLVVRVTDGFEQPVPGVVVQWTVSGGGQVSPAAATTDSTGVASTQRILGDQTGVQSTNATVDGVEVVATFTATATAPPTPTLGFVTKPPATVRSGVPFEQQPVVQIGDGRGGVLERAGVTVTVAIASGGGTLGGTTSATTGESGRAAFTDLLIVGSPGPRRLIFAADGIASVLSDGIDVVVGPVSESRSDVSVAPSTITASTGSSAATITVIARDDIGTPVAGAPVTVSASGGGNHLNGTPAQTGADGTARVNLSSTRAEPKTVRVTLGGVELDDQLTVEVVPAPASGPESEASVGDGIAGEPTTVRIEARDRFGNRVSDAATMVITVQGANGTQRPAVSAVGEGSYAATYTPTIAGTDQITVQVNGEAVGGSPLQSVVVPGPAAASGTTATIPDAIVFRPTTITVQTADAFGNPLTHGGEDVAVFAGGQPIAVTDLGDGRYQASHTPFFVGSYRIDVMLNGLPIEGSPFQQRVDFP